MDDFFNRNGTMNQLINVGMNVGSSRGSSSAMSRLGSIWSLLKLIF